MTAGPAAASVGGYPHDFRLYTWTGKPEDQPQERTANLAGLNPEGIVELPPAPWLPTTEVELVSDEGGARLYGDGVQAKTLPIANFKKCRSDLVSLGETTQPIPLIVSASLRGAYYTIRWRALKGLSYRLQSTAELGSGSWTDESPEEVATGPYMSRDVPVGGAARCYRVRLDAAHTGGSAGTR